MFGGEFLPSRHTIAPGDPQDNRGRDQGIKSIFQGALGRADGVGEGHQGHDSLARIFQAGSRTIKIGVVASQHDSVGPALCIGAEDLGQTIGFSPAELSVIHLLTS